MRVRYSRWDGSQRIEDLDADDLLNAMADDLTADGDLKSALRRLLQRGMHDPNGPQMPGLQDLLQQLRRRRQQQLERYDLGSALDDIKNKLADVVKTEREGMKQRLPRARSAPGARSSSIACLPTRPDRSARSRITSSPSPRPRRSSRSCSSRSSSR